jgi:2-keto-4-pentenoate hydratase
MTKEQIAEQLRNATLSKETIAPISEYIGHTDLEAAYEIQRINTMARLSNGNRIIGKKIGLTSISVQQQLGVDQPDYGILFSDMELLNGLSVPHTDLMQPKAEAEIAFVLAEDLDYDNLTIIDLISCIDYALPAIEIVGSRIRNWEIKLTDTIADNASASRFVLGHTPKTLDEIDVVNCTMQLSKNGTVVSEGTGADCMGSPLNAMLWLSKKMIELGEPLRAGELILSGALGAMVDVVQGDNINAEIKGLGQVSVSFS